MTNLLFLPTKAAKMANYAKCQILCNLLFAMFAILFISSRLGVYPVWYVPPVLHFLCATTVIRLGADSISWVSIRLFLCVFFKKGRKYHKNVDTFERGGKDGTSAKG